MFNGINKVKNQRDQAIHKLEDDTQKIEDYFYDTGTLSEKNLNSGLEVLKGLVNFFETTWDYIVMSVATMR